MTDGAKPATRKKLAKEEALKSFSVVADGWAEAEQNEDKTAVPVVRMPETKPAKAELLTPAQKRQIWEKARYEALRQQPDAMAFHEEALARFEQDGMLKKLAKTNGLTEDEARRVWSVFLEHHRIRTQRRRQVAEPKSRSARRPTQTSKAKTRCRRQNHPHNPSVTRKRLKTIGRRFKSRRC